MTATRFMPLLIIKVLQIFRDRIRIDSAWTVEEILQVLLDERPLREEVEFYYYWTLKRFDPDSNIAHQWLTAVLQSLAELGLVALDDCREESSGFQRWRIGDSWHPPEPPSGGDGGGGNVGSTAGGRENSDDDGGGLHEALGHPVLFALPQDDFDELVNNLFSEVKP